jgi:hypothetical protein
MVRGGGVRVLGPNLQVQDIEEKGEGPWKGWSAWLKP